MRTRFDVWGGVIPEPDDMVSIRTAAAKQETGQVTWFRVAGLEPQNLLFYGLFSLAGSSSSSMLSAVLMAVITMTGIAPIKPMKKRYLKTGKKYCPRKSTCSL